MEFVYQIKSHHFPVVYRLVRKSLDRATVVSIGYLIFSTLPALCLLAWRNHLAVAVPFLVVAFITVVVGRWNAKQQMREQFQTVCVSRTLNVSPEMLAIEWRYGWSRHSWSSLSNVAKYRGWLALYQKGRAGAGAMLPPEMVAEASQKWQVDLESQIRQHIRQAPGAFEYREESEVLKSFTFALTTDEMSQLAERSFQQRDAPDSSQGVVAIVLFAAVVALSAAPVPETMLPFVREVLAPVLAVPMAMAALAPLRRKAMGKLIGDRTLLKEQQVLIRQAGIEHRAEGEQMLARWEQVSTTIDAKRFLVILTHHGGMVTLPRRIFLPGEDEQTLELVSEWIQRSRVSGDMTDPLQDPRGEAPLAESDNPYQPPQDT